MKLKTTILFFIALFIVACNDKSVLDDNLHLSVDKVNIELSKANDYSEVTITKGAGKYSVTSSNSLVAQSLLLGDKLYITGNNIGVSVITVSDDKGNQVKINVSVNEFIPRAVPVCQIVFIKKGASKSISIASASAKYMTTDTTSVLQFQESTGSIIVTGLKTGKSMLYRYEDYWPTQIYDCEVVDHYTFIISPSASTARVAMGNEAEVYIHMGNGDYSVTSSNSTAVTAELRPWPIAPTLFQSNPMIVHYKGNAVGNSNLIITDKETGSSKTITVTVY